MKSFAMVHMSTYTALKFFFISSTEQEASRQCGACNYLSFSLCKSYCEHILRLCANLQHLQHSHSLCAFWVFQVAKLPTQTDTKPTEPHLLL